MPHKAYIQTLSATPQLLNFRNAFVKKRYVFLPGAEMIRVLSGLGAKQRDIKMLQNACSNLPRDPTLPFRRAQMGRFLFDQSSPGTPVFRRGEHQPWVLSGAEDFVRHDSGKVRHFNEVTESLHSNTAFQALLAFKFFMMQGAGNNFAHRPSLDYSANTDICAAVPIRTTTTPKLVGEPALEGVHADGVDFTMTTFINGSNMTSTSAQTLLHTNEQKNATAHCDTLSQYHVAKYQHRDFLDTLLFLDHELKHSLSPVEPADATKDSHRDMIVFVTRKPCLEGDIRYSHDSLKDHPTMPLRVGIRPGLIPLNKEKAWDHAEIEQPAMPIVYEEEGFRARL
ncbi:hypothetical protein EG328_004344 [Venturia inaequalis]|uniref:2OG-Fe dioxygenase-domain-containing protein n=1 Tax=Venturia inaequalis TaxID=5025 RepID=A0A8H3VG56_VENIN|nr:hypothetical protein EG328_004344 [Venturia inaequalis]